MIDWLKTLLGWNPSEGSDAPVRVGEMMSEPEAYLWAERLRNEGIGAGVKNEGIPPYTSAMSATFSVWVSPDGEETARRIMGGDDAPDDLGDDAQRRRP